MINQLLNEVTIYVNYKCNLRCKTCYMYGESIQNYTYTFSRKNEEMPFELFKKAVDDVLEINRECVFFIMGGEPLLYDRIGDAVKYIKKHGDNYVDINTNGTLIKRNSEELVKAGLDMFIVSLDGATSDACDSIRGRGVFNKVLEGIEYLRSAINKHSSRTKIAVNIVVTNKNYNNLRGIIELCNKLQIDSMFLNLPVYMTQNQGIKSQEYFKTMLNIDFNSWKGFLIKETLTNIDTDILKEQLDSIITMDKNFNFEIVPHGYSPEKLKSYFSADWASTIKSNSCSKLNYRTTILPNGDITPCTIFLDLVFGNISEKHLKEVWNGTMYNVFRRELSDKLLPVCYRCCDLLDESDGDTYVKLNREE